MAKKSKDQKDNKHDGGGCGQMIGCLILIAAVLAVVIYFIVRPEMEERGITLDSLKNQTLDLKDQIAEKVDATRNSIEEAGDKASDMKENVEDKIQDLKDTGERVKENIPEAPAQLYEE